MFKRVLLCYDGSDAGRRALRRGAELAIQLDAHAYVLSIVPGGIRDPYLAAGAAGHACIVDTVENRHEMLLRESVERLRSRGVTAEGYLTSGNVIDQIASFAKRLNIDLIVLGHYPQPSGGFWWSGAQRTSLAERANCCVLVAVDTAAAGATTGAG
jgi:nucleotide-binding universal stress UspA family protein